jgi:L-rhamnose-H+ transport protein
MEANPFFGVLLHATGGLAAASFYIPYKGVKGWSWEVYWLIGGFFSWIIAPWALALIILPQTLDILSSADTSSLMWTWIFGAIWGVGGLTFGLTMRYLGIALGYAIALGLCAVFGTLVPPLFQGELVSIATSTSGQVILLGVLICLVGIALSGKAGMRKEQELTDEEKQASVHEFSFVKGVLVALVAGVLSAAMAYAFAAGKPIAETAVELGAPPLWQNLPVLIVALFGGFVTNCVWCVGLAIKNRSTGQFLGKSKSGSVAPRVPLKNYFFCALAGVTWYLQFFFYGMGSTQMGQYDFSSWTLHMACIIIFSTLWGIAFKEWRGTSKTTHGWIGVGLMVLILSTVVIGYGNTLGADVGH